MNEQQIQIIKTEKPNSYEFGKAGNRFKVYYDTPEDLKLHIEKLKILKIYIEDKGGENDE